MASDMVNENSPLLPQQLLPNEVIDEPFSLWRDFIGLTRQTIPICFSFALQNAVQMICVLTAGTIGPFELEVTSYGFMFYSCTGSMVAIGGATALDTLCAHASSSQQAIDNPRILGRLLQQCLTVLLGLFMLIIAPIWVFSGSMFAALGQEPVFAHATGRFIIFMLPAGALQVIAECLRKFLQVQGESNSVGAATALASVVAVILDVVLVRWTSLGLLSVPCAFAIYQIVTMLLLLGSITYKPVIRRTWCSSITGMLDGLPQMMFYAVTGIATIATEWWSFELLAIMAARLSPSSIGAHSILMSSDLLFTTISLGVSVATSHRIGVLLGANRGHHARKSAMTPFMLAVILGALEFVGIMLARDVYGRIFTHDVMVVLKTAQVLPLMAGFQVLDLSNGGAGGVLRGAGKTHLSGLCNFLGYYGVGLPSAWFLCFRKGHGVHGLWAGIVIGSGALLVFQSCCILSIRWNRLASHVSKVHFT